MPELLLAIPELIAAIPEGLAAGAGTLGAAAGAADLGAAAGAADLGAAAGAADLGAAAGAAGAGAGAAGAAGSVLLPTIDVVGAAAPAVAAGGIDAGTALGTAGALGGLSGALSDFGGAAGSALGAGAGGLGLPSAASAAQPFPGALPGGGATPATSGPGPSGGGGASASGIAAPPSASPTAATPDLTANANAPLTPAGGTPSLGGPSVAPTNALGAPTAVPPAATGGSSGGFNLSSLSPTNLLSSAGNQIAHNPLALLGAAPLAIDLLKGNQKPAGYGTLENQANQANANANQLEGYLSSGQLPPGLQTALQSATNSVEASIRSQYANLGQSGSSAETQAIQSAKENAVSQGASIAMQLYNTGLSQAQLADSIYAQLMQTSMEQDQALSSAVGNFAGSLALMGSRGSGQQYTLTPATGS